MSKPRTEPLHPEISTKQAIEVCIARLNLRPLAERDLAQHLHHEIRHGATPPRGDADELRAAFAEMALVCKDTRPEDTKPMLLAKIRAIRDVAKRVIVEDGGGVP